MRVAAVIMGVMLTGCSAMFQPLTSRDVVGQMVVSAITIADCMQTHEFKHLGLKEQNTFLGDHPSDTRVDLFCAAAIGVQWLGLYAIPEKARPYYQLAVGGGEIWAVRHNHRDGAKIDF